jgi:hypothetical protein
MQLFCQILLAINVLVSLLALLWTDFHGRPAKEPAGFVGAVATLIVIAGMVLVYWKAGALSLLIP